MRKFDADHIHGMIETILPNVADALQPYWAQFSAEFTPSSGDFGGYLAARDEEVAEALLAITDRRRDNSHRPTIVKAYNTIRGRAEQAGEGGAARARASSSRSTPEELGGTCERTGWEPRSVRYEPAFDLDFDLVGAPGVGQTLGYYAALQGRGEGSPCQQIRRACFL